MAPETHDARIETLLRTMQIIAAAVMGGLIAFIAAASVLALDKPPGDRFLAVVAAVVAGGAVAMRFVLPGAISAGARRRLATGNRDAPLEPADLASTFQMKTIVEFAVLEAAGIVAAIALIVTVQWWLLAVAGIVLAIMAAGFPTRGRFDD